MPERMGLVFTCEHGGYGIPRTWAHLFKGAEEVLRSHRGWDPGTLELAERLAEELDAPLVANTTTRLLAELNRSEGHPGLFSSWSKRLDLHERSRMLDEVYRRHWRRVGETLDRVIAERGCVLHVSVHSFTPVFHGRRRRVDIGLLHDPARANEQAFAKLWQGIWQRRRPDLKVWRNMPYRGWTDGLVTSHRKSLVPEQYMGFELEVNQRLVTGPPHEWTRVRGDAIATLREAMTRWEKVRQSVSTSFQRRSTTAP